MAPSGKGEAAARAAVCLPALSLEHGEVPTAEAVEETAARRESDAEAEADECLFWSPTGSGACLQWASEQEAWRRRRFERVQMEGTRDPRRGGSGTTR